ncbi:MAG: MBOAT family protein [Planctomycetota bacterium]
MSFSTLPFFNFIALFILLFLALRKVVSQRLLLLAGSWAFYGFWSPGFLLLLVGASLLGHGAGLAIGARPGDRAHGRRWVAATSVLLLCNLAFFKYLPVEGVTLPLAISFYTFEILSYVVDVHKGRVEARRSFTDTALFIAFFPHLIAGPILRAGDFFRQLPTPGTAFTLSLENTAWALQRFVWGLVKKLLVSPCLSDVVDPVFADPASYSGARLAAAALFFSAQLYVDFSAYSDMALALGRFFGIRLPENFNNPYFARNIQDFWKRWHMTLSSWLTDYMYTPLQLTRRIPTGTCLMITMGLCGLWHGAGSTFVVWGLFHGVLLVLYSRFQHLRIPPVIMGLATYLLCTAGLVIFRAESLPEAGLALQHIGAFLAGHDNPGRWISLREGGLAFGLVALASMAYERGWHRIWGMFPPLLRGALTAMGLWASLAFSFGGQKPFYYFIF